MKKTSMVIDWPSGPITIFNDWDDLTEQEKEDILHEYTEEELAAMSEEEREALGYGC